MKVLISVFFFAFLISSVHAKGVSKSYDLLVQKKYKQAYTYLQKKDKTPQEWLFLGHMYRLGMHVPQDSNKAIEIFTKLAEEGNAEAMVVLPVIYNQFKNVEKINYWIDQAIAAKHPDAFTMKVILYSDGFYGQDHKYSKSYHLHKAVQYGSKLMFPVLALGYLKKEEYPSAYIVATIYLRRNVELRDFFGLAGDFIFDKYQDTENKKRMLEIQQQAKEKLTGEVLQKAEEVIKKWRPGMPIDAIWRG